MVAAAILIFEISKMPPFEILHNPWKLGPETFVNSYQPSKSLYNISTLTRNSIHLTIESYLGLNVDV